MSVIRSIVFLTVIATCTSLLSQVLPKPPQRDPMLLDVLARVVNAAGGAQALAAVHGLTESGEITFHWGEGHAGPVRIQAIGGNHFRMEADLPEGRRTWLVNDGNGTRKEADQKPLPLSGENPVSLGNLTFPIAQIAAVLGDARTDISLVGIEKRDGRSIYRLRVKGRLGLCSKPISSLPVVKDLLIDALNFSILSVEDRPFQTYEFGGKPSHKPSRAVEFSDFRTVTGVLVPFSISMKVMGQPTLSIHLTSVAFNNDLSAADFKN